MNIEPMILNVTIDGMRSSFTLLYDSVESTNISPSDSERDFDSTLTAIIDGATESSILVTKSVCSNQTTFQIVFFEAVQRNTLQVGRHDSSLIDVTITTVQMGRFPDDLILTLPFRSTSAISLPSEQSVVEDQLHNIISVSCTKTAAGQIFWTHTYDNSPGRVWGKLDNTIDPMCGRYSLKNPTNMFFEFRSQDEITQTTVGEIPWEIYNWVSFVYILQLHTYNGIHTYMYFVLTFHNSNYTYRGELHMKKHCDYIAMINSIQIGIQRSLTFVLTTLYTTFSFLLAQN